MIKHRNRVVWMLYVVAAIAATIGVLTAIFYWNNRPPNIKIPTHSVPKDNGWDYFVRAAEMIAKTRHWGPMSDPTRHKWTIAEYESFIQDNSGALSVLREGLEKPCVHPAVRSVNPFFESYASLRETARTLLGEAEYYEVVHKPGKAMDARLDCAELGVMMAKGGPLISVLVGRAIESMAVSGMEPLVPKLSPEDLARATQRLEIIQSERQPFSSIILEEGYASTAEYCRLFQNSSAIGGPRQWIGTDDKHEVWKNVRLAFCSKTAVVRENLTYFEVLASEQKGYYSGKSTVHEPKNPLTDKWGYGDVVTRVRTSLERNTARLTIIKAEVALRRYRADHGSYPSALGQLVPTYLKLLPVDPFGKGKPLCYKLLDNNKFLLYSRGYDLKDDGGKPTPRNDPDLKGDFVAGHLDMQRP